jgi:hypothetical protein
MTFFTQAVEDGTIDSRMNISEQELEMMIKGMLQDSAAWERHANRHKDAKMVPIDSTEELSEFERKVGKKTEEQHVIQYDMHSKKFVAGCQCGQKFEIDVNTQKVEPQDPNLKMKEISQYDRNNSQYGKSEESTASYDRKPDRMPAVAAYNNGPSKSGYKG